MSNKQDMKANTRGTNGDTSLHEAVRSGNFDQVKELLRDPRTDINRKDTITTEHGLTPLAIAVQRGDLNILQALLERPEIQVNTQDTSGFTPLHRAGRHFINEENSKHQEESLHIISQEARLNIIQALVRHQKINVNVKSIIYGYAPLHMAILDDNVVMVTELFQHQNIDVNVKTTHGRTPLHMAILEDNVKMVTKLLNHPNIEVNTQSTEHGRTPLHMAILEDNAKMVTELLSHPNIDVFVKDKDGDTAFHLLYTQKGPKFNDTIYTKFKDHILRKAEEMNISQLTDLILKVEPPRKLKSTGFVEKRDMTISTLQAKIDKNRQEQQVDQKFRFDHKDPLYSPFVNSSSVQIVHLIKKIKKANPNLKITEILKDQRLLNASSLDLVRKIQKVNNILENNKKLNNLARFVMKRPALQEKELENILKNMQEYISLMKESQDILKPLKQHNIQLSHISTQPPTYATVIKPPLRNDKLQKKKVTFQLPNL
ncbi:ankyrin repeat domain-containing protein [Candidatus Tisiphia endosymbiont of Beris chalybata]|uniref:ankyrin repeat domain-containing protein n=1 Tax=Candidatus Tisiphia endosymbiont of Beris chalybata TaxID=3066262 RepID=UPI00312CC030